MNCVLMSDWTSDPDLSGIMKLIIMILFDKVFIIMTVKCKSYAFNIEKSMLN